MIPNELDNKYFSRERVRARMLKRAAEVWGFSETEMDDFDPLVNLLMEALAVEVEKVAGEIPKAQHRMLERLAQLLHPGTVDAKPACGVIQVRSAEPVSTLYPDAQFVYKTPNPEGRREAAAPDCFFSPAWPMKIVDGAVKAVASRRELFRVYDGTQKQSLALSARRVPQGQYQSFWIGLDLHPQVTSLEGLSFFFYWANRTGADAWYTYLPYASWFAGGKALAQRVGFPEWEATPRGMAGIEHEFDSMQKMEEEVGHHYDRHYVTLLGGPSAQRSGLNAERYPLIFEQWFSAKDLQELKDPLIWVEVRFPTALPEEALDSLFCSLNAVTVLNRRLNRMTYKLMQTMNIVPLESDGIFLSVKEITNSQGTPIRLIPVGVSGAQPPETYALRYGINRFDERDTYQTLVALTELIREESAFFSSLGEDFLEQNIRDLNQIHARLEDKIKGQTHSRSPHPFLMVRPRKEGANILIEYWTSNGETANKIPLGSRLTPYQNGGVRSGSVFMIQTTFGGRARLTDKEKIDQYKRMLLTHHRVVTLEDVRAFVTAELGLSLAALDVRKTYIKGTGKEEGFLRCIQVLVTPASGGLEARDWEERLRTLSLKLQRQSSGNIPYQFILSDKR
jgi:hypothetical protein